MVESAIPVGHTRTMLYNKIVLWKQMWMEVWKVSGEGGGSGGWQRGGKRKVGKEKKQDKYLNE